MPRSVVLRGTTRCAACHLPPRWCICDTLTTATTEVAVAVLAHREELHKPSSTGLLLQRVLPHARLHAFDHRAPTPPEAVLVPGRETWILHPSGEPPPAPPPPRAGLHLVLLDGNWRQAGKLLRHVRGWGRTVRLPLDTPARGHLRTRPDALRGCTAEALAHALDLLGEPAPAAALRLQLEVHVAAFLLSRGKRDEAVAYLDGTAAAAAFPTTFTRLLASRAARG